MGKQTIYTYETKGADQPCNNFYSVKLTFQDYVSSYETGQSTGGAKMGEPREKPLDTPASRT